jgi:hypothetical protein
MTLVASEKAVDLNAKISLQDNNKIWVVRNRRFLISYFIIVWWECATAAMCVFARLHGHRSAFFVKESQQSPDYQTEKY